MPEMMKSRRGVMQMACAAAAIALSHKSAFAATQPRLRVIADNDFSGDPDGLFQLAHHVLSPSVALPLVICSHLSPNDFWDRSADQPASGVAKAGELLDVMGLAGKYRIVPGVRTALSSRTQPAPGEAAKAIVREAMRDDATPLFYAAGAGLTDLALAWLAEPRIGKRLKLIWIGGSEHPGLGYPPPGADDNEYNFAIDARAAQIIFNESDIEIWQVPRNAYREMLFSVAELEQLAATGRLGAYLKGQIDKVFEAMNNAPPPYRRPPAATYALGDSPLVTLTALQSTFQDDPSSSAYTRLPTPLLNEHGSYTPRADGRPMRVYSHIDTRLTFADMMAKFASHRV